MVAFTRILAGLSLLPAIQALALPGDVDGNTARINNPPEVPDKPLWSCDPVFNMVCQSYDLFGKDWNMTEHQIHQAIDATPMCLLTGWKWQGAQNPAHPVTDPAGRPWDFKAEVCQLSEQSSERKKLITSFFWQTVQLPTRLHSQVQQDHEQAPRPPPGQSKRHRGLQMLKVHRLPFSVGRSKLTDRYHSQSPWSEKLMPV